VALDAIIGTQPSLPLIDSLVISNTPIEYLPAFAFRQLSIKRLVLRHNQLVGMHPSAFDGGPIRDTLIEIEIRSNRLGEIPQSGLTSLRNLRAISLSRNGIVSVPDHSFLSYQCRTILRRLDLSDNQLVDIAPLGLLGLESIEALSLDKNRFERIPTAAIAHLVSLEDLSLGVNRINRIDVGALPLPNLRSLSVEVNQLVSIDAEAFQLVPNLLYLYLSNNQFAHIDPNTFYYVNRLRVLAMGNNRQLTSVNASALQYVPELVRLELADCSIANIDRGAFHKIARVQVIVLARNRLTR
jgi:Leucine-rich repeat (LRR) protein